MDLTTENTPFIFQQENYTRGMRFSHTGQFIHPNGDSYEYPSQKGMIPLGWNFCYPSSVDKYDYKSISNLYGYISPEDLFYNLSLCNFYLNKEPSIDAIDLKERVEKIMDTCEKSFEYNYGLCDGGYRAKNVYVYRENRKMYERFTLKHSGIFTVNYLGLIGCLNSAAV